MAQDFFIDSVTDDWVLQGGTTIRLCETQEELIRQQLFINLSVFSTEWFADVTYGVTYFESIFGKNNKESADAIFKATIRNTEGVTAITKFLSSIDSTTRKYSLTFSVLTDTGEITDIEVGI